MWVACGVRSRPAPEYPYVYTKPTSASGIAHPSSQCRGLGIPDRLTNSIRNAMFGLSKLLQQHAVNRLSFFAKKRPPIDRFGLSFSLEYRAWKWNMATAKPRKRIKYSQQWKDSYRDKYPCLEQYCYRDLTGKKVVDSLRATCTICKCDFGISHGGLTDCRRHCESEAHVKNAAKRKGVVKLTAFVDSRPENTEELQAVRASALLGLFIVETNQSISSADALAKLAPHMFPDSNIAAKMTSGRSKTTAVIKVNYFVICFNLMHFLKPLKISVEICMILIFIKIVMYIGINFKPTWITNYIIIRYVMKLLIHSWSCEWISNFIIHFIMDVITCPCWD